MDFTKAVAEVKRQKSREHYEKYERLAQEIGRAIQSGQVVSGLGQGYRVTALSAA